MTTTTPIYRIYYHLTDEVPASDQPQRAGSVKSVGSTKNKAVANALGIINAMRGRQFTPEQLVIDQAEKVD